MNPLIYISLLCTKIHLQYRGRRDDQTKYIEYIRTVGCLVWRRGLDVPQKMERRSRSRSLVQSWN